MWTVIFAQEFQNWLKELSNDEQDSVVAALLVLQQHGYDLGRPYVDTLKGSSVKNLKELRIQHRGSPYRAFFAFDPLRQAIILCAGNKQNDKRFYERMIPLAETIYTRYLASIDSNTPLSSAGVNHGNKLK